MAEVIRMPKMSDTMEEGVIAAWLKKVGDSVKPGDILAEVETDKATMELESYEEGVLLHIGVKEKDSVSCKRHHRCDRGEGGRLRTLVEG
jgi:pyruvate dehydrogenase E2 component (dihydrolipoamide acetyltransferase)